MKLFELFAEITKPTFISEKCYQEVLDDTLELQKPENESNLSKLSVISSDSKINLTK